MEGYSILPNKKTERSTSFCKYYALNDNSVDALVNMYVYATHPNQFNDSFDCNENLIKFETWEDAETLLYPFAMSNLHEYFNRLEEALLFCRKIYKCILYKKLGLVSLTPRYDNYQMWALYAGNSGFCIEYDVEKFVFQNFGPFPMNYTERISSSIPIGIYGGHIAMLIQSNVKNKWWEYEDEWRLYIPNPVGQDMRHFGNKDEINNFNFGDEHNRKFYYPTDALKNIILGPKFFSRLTSNEISSNEMDVVCIPNVDSLEYRVLDFLARMPISAKYAVLSGFSDCIFVPLRIIKYAENKFRIFFV